ncbi:MAG: 3-deoxy-D-manno-octulosonic acid transferase [Hyphomonas sp.]|nr:3-deoxy-D-manno-octulosonic acid transferase [Hyphomonas sp.]MCB9961790.1 3-deoxy-D-manno-octulosonic acid transferase [Hyphomonas sp.]MCB9972715.1 3-deoxy-D-manno-octulosonic acid transferase [Hyphomonas sp.]MCC0017521.1 3-deoxy-D-manno-octulosonic acid transferase [Rhodobiaceae bacterium]
MTPALHAYRILTGALSPFAGFVLRRRVRAGKEDYLRLHERTARRMPGRKSGTPLVWLHGASVGESRLLLELGNRLLEERPDLMLLFTSQTQTSAKLLEPLLPDNAFHQMAPLDTPGAARRFVRHWSPDLCIFGEGEIWPNLILEAEKAGARRALVNGRMTEDSFRGWMRLRGAFRRLVGRFDVVLAADEDTARRLATLLGKPITCAGNLKSALPPPAAGDVELRRLHEGFKGTRRCYLAASTHEGEEALFLEAMKAAPEAALIIAPRHPERGPLIEDMLRERNIPYARRSRGEAPTMRTQVLLADTMGEMGLWFRLADAVFLGGGNTPDVGGHNPLEPIRLGKPVVSGPDVFNFAAMMQDLEERGLVRLLKSAKAIGRALVSMEPPSAASLDLLAHEADAPMQVTLEALRPVLPAEAQS